MSDSSTQSGKLQWKWVGYSLLMFILFYILPLIVMVILKEPLGGRWATYLIGGWFLAGIVVVGAAAGFISKGVTILEPAIGGAAFVLLYTGLLIGLRWVTISVVNVIGISAILALFFLTTLLGAWLGERAQKLWRTEP